MWPEGYRLDAVAKKKKVVFSVATVIVGMFLESKMYSVTPVVAASILIVGMWSWPHDDS